MMPYTTGRRPGEHGHPAQLGLFSPIWRRPTGFPAERHGVTIDGDSELSYPSCIQEKWVLVYTYLVDFNWRLLMSVSGRIRFVVAVTIMLFSVASGASAVVITALGDTYVTSATSSLNFDSAQVLNVNQQSLTLLSFP